MPKHTLTPDEEEQVLSQPDIETDAERRDRAILEVLYSTGILAVRQGKGKKDRFVPIGDRALQWVTKYLDDVRPQHILPYRAHPARVRREADTPQDANEERVDEDALIDALDTEADSDVAASAGCSKESWWAPPATES